MLGNRRMTALIAEEGFALPAAQRLARRLLLRHLEKWRHGHLTVRLPEGDALHFGDPAATDRAALTVTDDAFFTRVALQGELGAGEAYQDGLWRADDMVTYLRLFVRNIPALSLDGPLARAGQLVSLIGHKLRRNDRDGSSENIHAHYDLGNALYRLFLDETMTYSCGIWESPDDTLADAQRRKLERICQKLDLRPGDRLIEVGCGWGGFAIHAATTRRCRVTAVTISSEQHALATERVREAGVADLVEVVNSDYRDLEGRHDALVSIEMFEAVGEDYWDSYFAACARLLRPGGKALLQTIAMPDQRFPSYRRNVDWMQKHIFPGSCIPGLGAMVEAMAGASDLVVENVEDIGVHYAPTLRCWREAFFARLDEVRGLGFDDRFIRTWELYLAFSEAAFAERALVDYQIGLRRPAR